jgi:prepilin-type N-terminal cleavage/methylation domain-containing protein/prepilin-type processing-associated H-X9-DG protein
MRVLLASGLRPSEVPQTANGFRVDAVGLRELHRHLGAERMKHVELHSFCRLTVGRTAHATRQCTPVSPWVSARGFTLTELLVVIAIIAILASLLMPALTRSKASAKRVVCGGNLRQIALALDMYSSDYDQYPRVVGMLKAKTSSSVSLWNALILPYMSTNLDSFFCPAFPAGYRWERSSSPSFYSFPTNIQGNRPFCYAMNQVGLATLGSLGLEADPGSGRKPGEVRAPGNMIAVGDDTAKTNKVGGWGTFTFSFQFGAPDPLTPIGRVHNSGGNMVFLDGHVEWDRAERWLGPSEAVARRWNYDDEPHHEFWAP